MEGASAAVDQKTEDLLLSLFLSMSDDDFESVERALNAGDFDFIRASLFNELGRTSLLRS